MPHPTSWHSLHLGDAILAQEPLDDLRQAFQQHQGGGAIYVRYRTVASLHCNVTAYFSPAATPLAQRFNASPCRAPSTAGLELLAGEETPPERPGP